MLGTDIRITS